MSLPWWQTLPLFVLILGILVLLHELGHFVTAKRFGMSAPEFGIGFPPRAARLWKSAGWIELQGRRIVVPVKFQMPTDVMPGTYVQYQTRRDNRGREFLSSLQVIDPEQAAAALASPVQNLDPGTEYTLNWLPLGGFVRLSGEEDPTAPNAFAAKPAWQRMIVLVAGVTMNFVLALVLMAVISAALPPIIDAADTLVTGVAANSPAAQADIRNGDLIVSLNGTDVRNRYDQMRQVVAANLDRPTTMVVERTGRSGVEQITVQITPRSNPPQGEGALGLQLVRQAGVRINTVAPGSLAAQIGLRPGDGLVSLGPDMPMLTVNASTLLSTGIRDEHALAEFVQSKHGVSYILPVTYIRDGVLQPTVNVKIPANLPADQADLGLAFHLSPVQATGSAFKQMWDGIASIPTVFRTLFQRGPEAGGLVGPVGIVRLTGEVAGRGGLWGVLNLLALLSLNLAVINLFPFPGLDGGRLVFVVLEVLRGGKKINPQRESIIHLIGFILLISLILFISYNDVISWLSGKPLLGP